MAQRGAIKLFSAVKAGQIKDDEESRVVRNVGVVGNWWEEKDMIIILI